MDAPADWAGEVMAAGGATGAPGASAAQRVATLATSKVEKPRPARVRSFIFSREIRVDERTGGVPLELE